VVQVLLSRVHLACLLTSSSTGSPAAPFHAGVAGMRRQHVFFFGLLGAIVLAGCGGNVILDSPGEASGGTGPGGSSTFSVGVGGAGGGTSTGPSGGNGFSCDFMVAGVHECAEYDNLPAATDVQALQSACTAEGGTSGTSCSSAGRLGTCTQSAGGLTYSASYYAGGSVTTMEAQQACESSGGTWTPG